MLLTIWLKKILKYFKTKNEHCYVTAIILNSVITKVEHTPWFWKTCVLFIKVICLHEIVRNQQQVNVLHRVPENKNKNYLMVSLHKEKAPGSRFWKSEDSDHKRLQLAKRNTYKWGILYGFKESGNKKKF